MIREGNIPVNLLESILETSINSKEAKKSNYSSYIFPEGLISDLSPKDARSAIIFYLQGRNKDEIRRVINKRRHVK